MNKGFVANRQITTIEDYLQEYERVTAAIQETDNLRTRRQLLAYRRKIAIEIKDYDYYRGTSYGKNIEI